MTDDDKKTGGKTSDGNPGMSVDSPEGIPDLGVVGVKKGQGAKPGGAKPGGIRSPAIKGSQKQPPRKKAPPPGQKPHDGPGDRPVSSIRGIDESLEVSQTVKKFRGNQGMVMVDRYRRRRKQLMLLALLALCGGLAVGGYLRPDYVELVTEKAIEYSKYVPFLTEKSENRSTTKRIRNRERERINSSVALDKELANIAIESCPYLRNSTKAILSAKRLSYSSRVAIADCFMMTKSYVNADRILKPVSKTVLKISDREMFGKKSGESSVLVAMVKLDLIKGRGKKAEQKLQGRCVRFGPIPSCLARLEVLLNKGLVNSAHDGFRKIYTKSGVMTKKNQAMLWAFGGKISSIHSREQEAEGRFKKAIALTPRGDIPLLKDNYEAYSMFLFRMGKYSQLQRQIKKVKKELKMIDKSLMLKMHILGELANPKKQRKTLNTILNRPVLAKILRSDLELVSALGPQVLRFGNETIYLKLISQTKLLTNSDGARNLALLKEMTLWEVRSYIAQGNYETALRTVNGYRSKYSDDYASNHLRGVIYLNVSEHEKYQSLAATEFSKSHKELKNWETTYALAVSLVRAGKSSMAKEYVKKMSAFSRLPGRKLWVELAKAEYYTGRRNYRSALAVLKSLNRKHPTSFQVHKQLVTTYRKAKKMDLAFAIERKYDNLLTKERYLSTKEGVSSPVGALALARRPVE